MGRQFRERNRQQPSGGGKKDATTAGKYHEGMAVFAIVKGGAMYEMSVSGEVQVQGG